MNPDQIQPGRRYWCESTDGAAAKARVLCIRDEEPRVLIRKPWWLLWKKQFVSSNSIIAAADVTFREYLLGKKRT